MVEQPFERRSANRGDKSVLPPGFEFNFTFRYPVGRALTTLELFDIRPEVCRQVGGFEHGEVVREPNGDESVVVGVLPDPTTGRPALWFCCDKHHGAWQFGHYGLMKMILTSVGRKQLEQAPAAIVRTFPPEFVGSLKLTFSFPCGLVQPVPKLFDIREEVCLEVGGFRHGQIVRTSVDDEMVVVGVRPDDFGRPSLWYLPRGADGAGIIDQVSSSPEDARRVLRIAGTETLRSTDQEPEPDPDLSIA